LNCNLFLKREDLQIVRSYKLRGAYYKILSLTKEEVSNGVVCASAGNHAQGVAYACKALGIKGTIFMPLTTPSQKIKKVKAFGGSFVTTHIEGDGFEAAYNLAKDYCVENNMEFIHPFNDPKIISGQGTVALEILNQSTDPIDYIFVPIGGGGLISGISTYFRAISPNTKIIGVEPKGAPAMKDSLDTGEVISLKKIDPFVDGAVVKKVGDLTFETCQKNVDDVIIVDEGKLCSLIIDLYNEDAIVAEPAGVLSIAGASLMSKEIEGKNVVCILSGGNNDITRMEEIKERSLIFEGLKHYFIIRLPQRSGALKDFLGLLGPEDNITHFQYTKKNSRNSGPALVGIELKNKASYAPMIERFDNVKLPYHTLNNNPDLFDLLV
jgi:threonine dehydratase